jgi:hypothetical protein
MIESPRSLCPLLLGVTLLLGGTPAQSQTATLIHPAGGTVSLGLGSAVVASGDVVLAGAGIRTGVDPEFVFHRLGTEWPETARLFPSDSALARGFGRAIAFDGARLPAGTYLYRLEAAGRVHTGRLALMR